MFMAFKVIETDWTKEFYETYEQVKNDLAHGLGVGQIKRKYGFSDGKWHSYYKELCRDGIMIPKSKSKTEPKYYSFYNGKYIVSKTINRRKYYIAEFKTEKEAQLCVQLMKECDWDLNERWRIKDEIRQKVKQ